MFCKALDDSKARRDLEVANDCSNDAGDRKECHVTLSLTPEPQLCDRLRADSTIGNRPQSYVLREEAHQGLSSWEKLPRPKQANSERLDSERGHCGHATCPRQLLQETDARSECRSAPPVGGLTGGATAPAGEKLLVHLPNTDLNKCCTVSRACACKRSARRTALGLASSSARDSAPVRLES